MHVLDAPAYLLISCLILACLLLSCLFTRFNSFRQEKRYSLVTILRADIDIVRGRLHRTTAAQRVRPMREYIFVLLKLCSVDKPQLD